MQQNGSVDLSVPPEDYVIVCFFDDLGCDMDHLTTTFRKLDDATKFIRLVRRSWKAGFAEEMDPVLLLAMDAHSLTLEIVRYGRTE